MRGNPGALIDPHPNPLPEREREQDRSGSPSAEDGALFAVPVSEDRHADGLSRSAHAAGSWAARASGRGPVAAGLELFADPGDLVAREHGVRVRQEPMGRVVAGIESRATSSPRPGHAAGSRGRRRSGPGSPAGPPGLRRSADASGRRRGCRSARSPAGGPAGASTGRLMHLLPDGVVEPRRRVPRVQLPGDCELRPRLARPASPRSRPCRGSFGAERLPGSRLTAISSVSPALLELAGADAGQAESQAGQGVGLVQLDGALERLLRLAQADLGQRGRSPRPCACGPGSGRSRTASTRRVERAVETP